MAFHHCCCANEIQPFTSAFITWRGYARVSIRLSLRGKLTDSSGAWSVVQIQRMMSLNLGPFLNHSPLTWRPEALSFRCSCRSSVRLPLFICDECQDMRTAYLEFGQPKVNAILGVSNLNEVCTFGSNHVDHRFNSVVFVPITYTTYSIYQL